jgi:hypothetical protein
MCFTLISTAIHDYKLNKRSPIVYSEVQQLNAMRCATVAPVEAGSQEAAS